MLDYNYVFLDIETSSLETVRDTTAKILGVVLSERNHITAFNWQKQREEATMLLNRLAANKMTRFVIHNAEFDVGSLRLAGVNIPPGRYICTKVLGHCINPQRNSHSLESYGEELGFHKLPKPAGWLETWTMEMEEYAIRDVELLAMVFYSLLPHLQQDKRLYRSYFCVHLPFVEVMMSLHRGMVINPEQIIETLQHLVLLLEEDLSKFNTKYPTISKLKFSEGNYHLTGKLCIPNLDSPNDMVSLLVSYGWKPSELTDSGRYKTTQALLKRDFATVEEGPLKELLKDVYEIRSCLGINKQLHTLFQNTRIEKNRVYCNWHQTGTKTHRLSSSSPNLQNISTRHPVWGPKVRACFGPPPEHVMLVGDLSQIELAILASYLELYVGDSSMAEAARNGRDFHDANTENWYNLTKDDAGFKSKRSQAKNGIFATNYGAAAKRLSTTLNISISEATEILRVVSDNIKIKELKKVFWASTAMTRSIRGIPHNGRTYTAGVFYDCLHTRHFYPDILSHDKSRVASAERQSFNCLMQGGCFSVFALLCTRLMHYVRRYQAQFAGLVHDEAILYCPEHSAEDFLVAANKVFSSYTLKTPQGGVPVRAEFKIVANWSEK